MLLTNEEILKRKIKQNSVKRVLFTIICLLVILPLIAYNVLLILELKVMPQKIIDINGFKPYIITSDIFSPEFFKGDIITIKDVSIENLKPGDIVFFYNGEQKEVAKVQEINLEDSIVSVVRETEGVNFLKASELVGQYDYTVFDLGMVVAFLQDKILLVYLLIIIYLLYMRNSYKTERSMIRKMKKEIYDKKIQNS